MNQIDDIIFKFVNRKQHPRELGRYNSSELYQIIQGKLNAKNFFDARKIDEQGVRNISTGIASEDYLTKTFKEMKVKVQSQIKKEIKITDEITLVAKPDFVFDNFILEVKAPTRQFDEIPIWYVYQLECYYHAFYLPVYLGEISHPFQVRIISYTPLKSRWSKIKRSLVEFDRELREIKSKDNNSTLKLKT